MNTVFKL